MTISRFKNLCWSHALLFLNIYMQSQLQNAFFSFHTPAWKEEVYYSDPIEENLVGNPWNWKFSLKISQKKRIPCYFLKMIKIFSPDFGTRTVPVGSSGYLQLAVAWPAVATAATLAGPGMLADCSTFGEGYQIFLLNRLTPLEQHQHLRLLLLPRDWNCWLGGNLGRIFCGLKRGLLGWLWPEKNDRNSSLTSMSGC